MTEMDSPDERVPSVPLGSIPLVVVRATTTLRV